MLSTVALALSACSGEDTPSPFEPPVDSRPVASVWIHPSVHTHPFSHDTVRIRATALDSLGYGIPGKHFDWTSSDTALLTVDSTGLVFTRAKGTAYVVAQTAGLSDTAQVTVDPGVVLSNECLRCHWQDNQTGHLAWGFDTMTCSSCHAGPDELHTTVRDGHADVANRFELIGAHGSIICGACHVVGDTALRFSPINQADCIACHQANYDTQHASTSYPTTCLTCHTMDAWAATFDHQTRSGGFALLGAHADLACTSCHDATTFAPLFSPESDTNCIACHQTDYDTQHAGTSYPTTCLTCHTTDGWATMFDHETKSGGFALLGVHADLVCTSCHDAVTFAPLFSPENHTDCFACHETDYEAQHSTAGYPTTCLTCHTTQSWTPSSFDHDGDYFPIFTGEHAPRWSGCATCHTDPDDFTVFTCFNCHAHDETPMNQKHAGISGYSYDSAVCYTCHPDGKKP